MSKVLKNKEDIKSDQILLMPIFKNGESIYKEKIINEIDDSYVRFEDGTWMDLQELVDSNPICIGQIKMFWKYFKYRSYF